MAGATYYAKQDDISSFTPKTVLRDGYGNPVDLTGATVRFIMRKYGASTPTVATAGEVVPPATNGEVRYEWVAGDLDIPGLYLAEWEVTYAADEIETFPADGYIHVWVREDLDDPAP